MMEEQGGLFGGLSGLDRIESGIPLEYELPTDIRPGPGSGATGVSGGANSRFGFGTPATVEEEAGTGGTTPALSEWDSDGAYSSGRGGAGTGTGGVSGAALAAAAARWSPQSAPPEWAVALAARLAVPWGPSRQSAAWTVLPGVVLETPTGGRDGATLAHTGLGGDTGLNRAFLWLAWNQGSAVMDAFFKPVGTAGTRKGGDADGPGGGAGAGMSDGGGGGTETGTDEGSGDEEEGRARGGRGAAGGQHSEFRGRGGCEGARLAVTTG
jgi:hypothetical protein